MTIPGEPVGWARPGGGRQRLTERRQRRERERIHILWAVLGRPSLPDGPWGMSVVAVHARPDGHLLRGGASLSAAGRRRPYPGAPDLDNVAKFAADALVSAGAVPDDRHLVQLRAAKRWARLGEDPHVQVSAWPLTAADDTQTEGDADER